MRNMKRLGIGVAVWIIVAWAALLPARRVRADLVVPAYVNRLSRLEQAALDAKRRGKALAFVYTNTATRCPKARRAAEDAFRILGERCVLVLVETNEQHRAPRRVRRALHAPEAGRYIPIVVVTTPGMDEVICIVPYTRAGRRQRVLERAAARIGTAMSGRSGAQNVTPIDDILARHRMSRAGENRPERVAGQPPERATSTPVPTRARRRAKEPPPPPDIELQITLRWKGDLVPRPDERFPLWALARGYRIEHLGSESGQCRFKVMLPDNGKKRFLDKLEGFLRYQYGSVRTGAGPGIGYFLGAR